MQVAERRAFASLPAEVPADTVRGLYPQLVAAMPGAVRLSMTDAAFHDVGTPAEYLRTVRHLARAEGRPLDRGAGTTIAASARVESTVCWDDVVVGEDAEVVGCVIGDGARVPDGLRVRDACLLPAARHAAPAGDQVIGDLVVVPFVGSGAAAG